ncbi:MAG: hypothetical protein K2H52_10700 [Lachnospiraceae bacterium]|nr:hypothetical protein [Lachnospiraceae bacterium]
MKSKKMMLNDFELDSFEPYIFMNPNSMPKSEGSDIFISTSNIDNGSFPFSP